VGLGGLELLTKRLLPRHDGCRWTAGQLPAYYRRTAGLPSAYCPGGIFSQNTLCDGALASFRPKKKISRRGQETDTPGLLSVAMAKGKSESVAWIRCLCI
jgi:hypothetical protein